VLSAIKANPSRGGDAKPRASSSGGGSRVAEQRGEGVLGEDQEETRKAASRVFIALQRALLPLIEIVALWLVGVVVTILCLLALWMLVQAVAGM
jgi:hypothetical protein